MFFPVCNVRRQVTLVCPKVDDVKHSHLVKICHYSSTMGPGGFCLHSGFSVTTRKYDQRKPQYYKGAARESVHTLMCSVTLLP